MLTMKVFLRLTGKVHLFVIVVALLQVEITPIRFTSIENMCDSSAPVNVDVQIFTSDC